MTTTPDLPVPSGAEADDWMDLTDIDGAQARTLTWSHHDTDKIGVAVDGWQYADGRVTPCVSLYDADGKELSAANARRLAAVLMDAADELDRLN